MNDKSYTYLSTSAKSFSSIDLSFCHPSLFLDYNWSVSKDQHNSDHFPIIIEQNTFSTEDHNPKWKLNRANWDLFNTLCTGKLIPENFKESSDPISDFCGSFMFLFCLVFAMFCARLFMCALWSPAGKGLTSWLSFVVSSVSLSLSHWYPGSGVVLDCIDS